MALRGQRLLLSPRPWAAALGLIGLASAPHSAEAGAWTQPPRHLYARVSYAGINSTHRFDAYGDRIGLESPGTPSRGTEYRSRELRAYAEYGLREGLTLYGSSALKRLRMVEPLLVLPSRILPETIRETSGVGDVSLGGRFRVRRGQEPVSLAIEVKIPSGYSPRANPALGNGQVDVTIRALAGVSAGSIYSTADAGWVRRGGGYPDAALVSFEVGGRVLRDYTWRGVVRGVRSAGKPSASESSSAFDPALASPRSIVLEAVVGEEIVPGLGVEAGISHALSGRSTLAGNTLEVGLVWSVQARGRP